MHMFKDITGKGTYATYDRAVERIEELNTAWVMDFRYLIASTTDGRFFPVVVLNRGQQHYCMSLAHRGICVTF